MSFDDIFIKWYWLSKYPSEWALLAQTLGYDSWHGVRKLITSIKDTKGVDITATDNKYHIALKLGHKSNQLTHKYTEAAVDLFKKVMNDEDYKLENSLVTGHI